MTMNSSNEETAKGKFRRDWGNKVDEKTWQLVKAIRDATKVRFDKAVTLGENEQVRFVARLKSMMVTTVVCILVYSLPKDLARDVLKLATDGLDVGYIKRDEIAKAKGGEVDGREKRER